MMLFQEVGYALKELIIPLERANGTLNVLSLIFYSTYNTQWPASVPA